MGMESFLSSMEQGDHLEQRRMTKHASSVSLSGKASKQGDSGKEERAGGGFFRTSKFRLICAAMAVATAVIGGVVVVLYLKDSEAGRGKSNSVKERFMAAVSYGNEETGGELDGGSPVDILIPKSTSENYADLWETFAPTDFPFFWLNPISSEPYIKQIYGNCYSMILSGQITEGQPNQTKNLDVEVDTDSGYKYINLDPSSTLDWDTAKKLDLVSSGVADLAMSSDMHYAAILFGPNHRGRIFAVLEDPVKRAVRLQYDGTVGLVPDDSQSLVDFARSGELVDNWMVRALTNEPRGELTSAHLDAAREILRRKVIVGFTELFEASMDRFDSYFGWHLADDQAKCRDRLVDEQVKTRQAFDLRMSVEEYRALSARLWADVQLFEYAKILYTEQGALVQAAQSVSK
jgi:hypothetical protein